jgi:hypothetical protein
MTTSRLEAFSDGVFAIAITLLVLEIRVPEDTSNLAHDLLDLWPSYLGYAISFMLIGLIWANTAVVLYGLALVVGGIFFNAVWEYARRGHRLLGENISPEQARVIGRRFLLGPVLYLVGAGLGALIPALGLAVFGFLILFYWLPITGVRA